MNCVVVVDAWEKCEIDDLKIYPWLEQETKLFGSFLDLQLFYMKEKFGVQIIHAASSRQIMKEMKTVDAVVDKITDLPQYDNYYFCGFHLGRCINTKINHLQRTNTGVIINLSMVFPEDSIEKFISKHPRNNYYYTYEKGLQCIDMKI